MVLQHPFINSLSFPNSLYFIVPSPSTTLSKTLNPFIRALGRKKKRNCKVKTPYWTNYAFFSHLTFLLSLPDWRIKVGQLCFLNRRQFSILRKKIILSNKVGRCLARMTEVCNLTRKKICSKFS